MSSSLYLIGVFAEYIRAQVVARHLTVGGLLDGATVFGGRHRGFGGIKPVPDMALGDTDFAPLGLVPVADGLRQCDLTADEFNCFL